MSDGSSIGMLTKVEMAELRVLQALEPMMKDLHLWWLNDLDTNQKIHLIEAWRQLEYARFHASGQKLEEGRLTIR